MKNLEISECFAIILVAALIFTPLVGGVIQNLKHAYWQNCSSYNNSDHSINIQGWLTFLFSALTLIVLIFQAYIYHRQRETMDRQTKIATDQYISAHRPRIRVRNVVLKSDCGRFVQGHPVSLQFYAGNIGGTAATVLESHAEIIMGVSGLPMARPYEGKNGNNPIFQNSVVKSNLAATGFFSSDTPYPSRVQPGIMGGGNTFFMGWIDYRDESGVRRRSAFCREAREIDGITRFYPVSDPDYDYEE